MLPALWTFYTSSTLMYWRDCTLSYNQAAILFFIIMLVLSANTLVG